MRHRNVPLAANITPRVHVLPRGPAGITEGLVKGALSVAASAYKALFTGPNCSVQVGLLVADPGAAEAWEGADSEEIRIQP